MADLKDIPSPALSKADSDFRNDCAKIALTEIVRWQVAEGKGGQEDVAASWAFRYADKMLAASKRPAKTGPTLMARGTRIIEEPLPEPTPEPMPEIGNVPDALPGALIPTK